MPLMHASINYKRALSLAVVFMTFGWMLWVTNSSRHTRSWTGTAWQRQPTLKERLSESFPYNVSSEGPKLLWQTWKASPAEDEFEPRLRSATNSWHTLNPDFRHEVITDTVARDVVHQLFADIPSVIEAYDTLPKPVLKADFFRYLILLARGGVYSDIDTTALKPISHWVPAESEPFGLVIGIEADPNRPDWHDWYARRIQFCQWTIMSKPGHPALVDIVASITEETLKRKSRDELQPGLMKTVMEFTGPGIWTDSIFTYVNISQLYDDSATSSSSSNTWQVFANLKEPMKVLDVVVLPITSFSPGVGHMGSGSTGDRLAFVSYGFSGSWKHDERSINAHPVTQLSTSMSDSVEADSMDVSDMYGCSEIHVGCAF